MLPSEVIKKHGWIQGRVGNSRTGFCTIGAIGFGLGNNKLVVDAYLNTLRRHISETTENVVLWNDAHNRTKEEVIKTLVKVEKELGLGGKHVAK